MNMVFYEKNVCLKWVPLALEKISWFFENPNFLVFRISRIVIGWKTFYLNERPYSIKCILKALI